MALTAKEIQRSNRGPFGGNQSNKRFWKMNGPPIAKDNKAGGWIWLTREMLESPAWLSLSGPAMRIVLRVIVEHLSHGGKENGCLPVTYQNFVDYGVSRKQVPGAIAEAVKYGFVDVHRGRLNEGRHHMPNHYGITWLPRCDGSPANNRWKGVRERRQKRSPGTQKGTDPVPKRELTPVPKRELGKEQNAGKPRRSPSTQKGTPIYTLPHPDRAVSVAPPRRKRSEPPAAPASPPASSQPSAVLDGDNPVSSAISRLASSPARRAGGRA